MKQKLLLLICLITFISWGKPKEKVTANPSIGILLTGFSGGPNQFFFNISIKNTGEETLTNVYVTEEMFDPNSPMQFQFSTIASLAPGEEVTNLQAFKFGPSCFDQSQVKVHATTASSTEITDLSADPYADYQIGVPGSYYNDLITQTVYYPFSYGTQDGIYNDLNGNNIIDVGDVINYTYNVNSDGGLGVIFDSNAIVTNPSFNSPNYYTTGIHYLTQADVDLGYVYNSSGYNIDGQCGNLGGQFYDQSSCFCPNPNGSNIITQLTSLLPNQISGTVKFNANNDNCASGITWPNQRVSATDGTYSYASYTNSSGNYHILIPNVNSYTTNAVSSLNANFSSNPTSVNILSSGSGVDYNNTDFCISSATNYADLSVNMYNINEAIPGNVATYRIYYHNNGSTNLSGSIQLTFDNGKLTFANAAPSQNNVSSNTVTWNYSNLLPFQWQYISVSFNVLTPPTVNTNDVLPFTVNGNPTAGDTNITNNEYTWNQTVRSSFDPNDKIVIEGAIIDIGQTNDYLTYVTHFQNTGNANATTVVIKETLDPKLDWNTFEPIDSSHASNIQIRNGNELTYTFSNINLAYESANESASHGWMAYRIKPKANVVIGDIMSSNSNIYFDYNLPILTNTVSTQITALATNDFVKSNFTVYPNPASNYLVIKSESNVDAQYEIIDVNGKLLVSNAVESMNPININTLQSGFYFINIKTNQGKATYKFIKN